MIQKFDYYTQPPKYPWPNPEQQKAIFREAKTGDPEAREKLWALAFSLAVSALRNNRVSPEEHEDILQEWALRVFSSLEDYKEEKGACPSTFFYRRVRHSIRDYTYEFCYPFRIPWRHGENPPKRVADTVGQELAYVHQPEAD